MSHLKTKYLVIGAGISGLSAAYYLKNNYIIVEASDTVGGTASTTCLNGFKLDNAVHVLYFRHSSILGWIKNDLDLKLIEQEKKCSVWLNNTFINFPVQSHLAELPWVSRLNSAKSILATLLYKINLNGNNFEDYSINTFGNYLTDIFIRPYNEKMFGIPISEINIDWMGDYIPQYSKVKMLISALKSDNNKYGRNSKFFYPVNGGISELAKSICLKLNTPPRLNSSLIKLSLKDNIAEFNCGLVVNYEFLINTIPLKSFLQKIVDLPEDISRCTNLMKQNSTTLIHILCKGNLDDINYHWIYVPNKNIPFYRVTIPGNINPANCPTGHFAITLEFGGNVFGNNKIISQSVEILKSMGVLKDDISEFEIYWKLLDCGYVIYDFERVNLLDKIFPYLKNHSIVSIGRYGNWEYSNMEDAILHGKNTSQHILSYS